MSRISFISSCCLALLAVTACRKEDVEPVTGRSVVAADPQVRRERDKLLAEMSERIAAIDVRLARMESRMRTSADQAMTATYERLRAARAELDRAYKNLQNAGADAVDEARSTFDKAADKVEELYQGLSIELTKLGHDL